MKNRLITLCVAAFLGTGVQAQNWKLVWEEEFEGTEVDQSSWNFEVKGGGFGNRELQFCTDRPENIKTENGKLIITAIKEEYKNHGYTSARINSRNKHDFTYGKIEARVKLPQGAGVWPAFWMLGYGSWPSSGEIDIMEYVGRSPGWAHATIHTKNYNGMNGQQKGSKKYVETLEEGFHTFGIEWTENKIKFFVDDMHYYSYSKQPTDLANWPFDKPCFIILNMAIGGTMGGAVDNSIFPQRYEVDYVRVYQEDLSGVESKTEKTSIQVMENPFSDQLNISVPAEGEKKITLTDTTGRVFYQGISQNEQIEIDTEHLHPGIYILSVATENDYTSQKVIKK